MSQLTTRQQQVYDFIAATIKREGFAPTLQEIAAHLEIKGNLGVLRHLEALEKKGCILRSSGRSRSIRLTRQTATHLLPLVGRVAAGPLTEALENIEDHISVDARLVQGQGAFLLRVSGDSMIEAHIADGDLAVIQPQQTANNGDIVVVMIEGEATLKRFFREQGCIRLQPENERLDPIILTAEDGEPVIIGKLTGLMRAFDGMTDG